MDIKNTTILVTRDEYATLHESYIRNNILLEYLKANEYWDEPEVFRILGDIESACRRQAEIDERIKKHS